MSGSFAMYIYAKAAIFAKNSSLVSQTTKLPFRKPKTLPARAGFLLMHIDMQPVV